MTSAGQADPLISEKLAPVRHVSLSELRVTDPIDASLIEMNLPPDIERTSVRLARQSVASWQRMDGKTRLASPAVVLWGLWGSDAAGVNYRGALIGIEGGAEINPVIAESNVLGLVNHAVGGGGIALDDQAAELWRRSEAPLTDGVRLLRTVGDQLDDLPEQIAKWIREQKENDAKFDAFEFHLGERSLPHVQTTALYVVDAKDGAFKMQQVGPSVRTVGDGFAALRLGSLQHPWRGQLGQGLRYVRSGTRTARLQEAVENPIFDPAYKLPHVVGDFESVVAEAEADYKRRNSQEVWRRFLPPPDDPDAIEAAQTFVSYLNAELLDLQLPESCSKPVSDDDSTDNLPYTARIRDLPFWDCYELVELTERVGGRRRRTSILWAKDPDRLPAADAERVEDPKIAERLRQLQPAVRRVVGLDGKAHFIHWTNEAQFLLGRLKIDETTIRSYTEFFCANVHGEVGSFTILEHADDVDWLGFHHVQRDVIGPRIFPMRFWPTFRPKSGADDDVEQGLFIEAIVTYGGGLFRSVFQVTPNGQIQMKEDDQLLSDLDTRSYSWTQKNNWMLATFPEVK